MGSAKNWMYTDISLETEIQIIKQVGEYQINTPQNEFQTNDDCLIAN